MNKVLKKYLIKVKDIKGNILIRKAKTENEIKKLSKVLGFEMKNAKYGPFTNEYMSYYGNSVNINYVPSLTFKNIDKEIKPETKTQKDFLVKMKKQNLDLIKINKIK